jgi:putative transcription factor
MSEWDTVTKIGKSVRGPGGSERETTVKGKSALNAAQRSGAIVGTEKKFATANVRISFPISYPTSAY